MIKLQPNLSLPPGWKRQTPDYAVTHVWTNEKRRLRVLADVETKQDGHVWLHVSVSHPKRVPNYDELAYVKRHFVGRDKKAIMVFPDEANHVNTHPFCLHLFHCLDGDPLPEFSNIVLGSRQI